MGTTETMNTRHTSDGTLVTDNIRFILPNNSSDLRSIQMVDRNPESERTFPFFTIRRGGVFDDTFSFGLGTALRMVTSIRGINHLPN